MNTFMQKGMNDDGELVLSYYNIGLHILAGRNLYKDIFFLLQVIVSKFLKFEGEFRENRVQLNNAV